MIKIKLLYIFSFVMLFTINLRSQIVRYSDANNTYPTNKQDIKWSASVSFHLLYPKTNLLENYETSFGAGLCVSRKISNKFSLGLLTRYTPLIITSQNQYRTNSVTDASFLDLFLTFKYYVFPDLNIFFNAGKTLYKTKTPVLTFTYSSINYISQKSWNNTAGAGASVLFFSRSSIKIMLNISYNLLNLDKNTSYYFIASIAIAYTK